MIETVGSAFTITPEGPFSWAAARSGLGSFAPVARHASPGSDTVRMTFPLDGDFAPTAVALTYLDGTLKGEVVGSTRTEAAARQVARIFALDHDGSGYWDLGRREPKLGRVLVELEGLRQISFTCPYECAAWAVMSQRISKRQAATAQLWLAREHGTALTVAGETVHCFPTPEQLLEVERVPGLSQVKVERLHGVAEAALAGRLDVDRLLGLGPVGAPKSLRTIAGIGDFWSEGIYLRACGVVDVFPNEPISIAALGHLHGLGDRPEPAAIAELTDLYRPYRMWVCYLLRVAAARGIISGLGGRETEIRGLARV